MSNESLSTHPSPASPRTLRLAIVGCGAVTKSNLMPVAAGHDRFTVTAVVDRHEGRARELAEAYNVPRVLTDMDQLNRSDIDAVVLATPPAHHAPATIALAGKGFHLFVEKPMAIRAKDAEAMVAAADAAKVGLMVGLYRRLLPAVRLLRSLIDSGDFGRPLSIDAEEGGPYGWQLATLDVLTSAAGGGGTLIDIGSHVLDVLLYVVPGAATLNSYEDNARGGIETDCVVHFTIGATNGPVPVRLELSRTRELRGSIRVECERATLELLRGNFTQILIHPRTAHGAAAPARITAQQPGTEQFLGYDAFRAQFDDWLVAIDQGRDCELSGRSVVPVVRLIEECYVQRRDLAEPWTDEGFVTGRAGQIAKAETGAKKKRVVVTGAGGFLGGRAVELFAHKYGYDVVALMRAPKGAARLARWPLEIQLGDICSAADMDRVLKGCDAVVHCAVGTSWQPEETRRVTVEGTRTVAEACLRAGVKRLVHISSMAVHKRSDAPVLDESVALEPGPTDLYGRNKLAAEEAVRDVGKRGLSAIVLRPARIYGPFSKTFTVRPLQALLDGTLAISGNPDIPSNMVYVDNVVDAMARAIEAPETFRGESYLVNDPDQLTLKQFFDYFGRPSGASVKVVPARSSTAPSAQGFLGRWVGGFKKIALSPEVRALVHRVMDTDPVGTLPKKMWNSSPNLQRRLLKLFKVDAAVIYRPAASRQAALLDYYGDPGVVSSEKARRELGFVPPLSREQAMALTMQWARAARLVKG